ncbi:PREDICTED: hepatocyte growth factor-regulated tyrosine kinase substrate isoform X1 [Bactrocera latifrons]|uniref:hepatocyte growth factor-regulated tyrosine kinase substrate isoform X1 n=1 Tax=Bactrocera latifrons TaxID=174628 RepID=UPI0008DC6CDC|nr:PREDICTED: hepatocyte growth factor-regulated tyrosine kinase substrate isoform X1 [Bactrocera latifrons]
MFKSSFEKNLENATSHLRLEPEWPSILLICDEINQKDVSPKNAFAAIKKKMSSPNPHSACYALLVLESVVKNCGAPMHDEVFTRENCEMFSNFLEQTPHENVRQKMLELVQTWAYAFRSSEKYQSIKDTMTILKAKGHTFPELKEADAMFTADTAPIWADGKVCHRCRDEFNFTNRKHHCRNCGQVFCGKCSSKQCPLPKFGIEKDVRVCDGCYVMLQRPNAKPAVRTAAESDLPAEYVNSSLSQQVQVSTPPRKTEQELKEEEELQLALALSQSEAEEKKKQQQQHSLAAYRLQQRSPSPEAPPAPKEYQQEETNPDLAKYLNRSYWEQRKVNESPLASPSAPSPMPTPQPQAQQAPTQPKSADEVQIDEFAANMRAQVDIFVNRMKSNSSRGRSISNDSSVQTLFMNLTSLHSQQLSYIKEMDDKRMWYEQLQDKLAQIKDSRAALDVLRQEHVEKLRRIAEEQERQRQIQMAQKLEIMRKKKQEYLQYQRQLALQRIQEQEREMQLRQEQQKVQYLMGQTAFPFMPPGVVGGPQGSPSHQMNNVYNPYAFNPNSPGPLNAAAGGGGGAQYNQTGGMMNPAGGPMAPGAIPPGMYAGQPNQQHPGMMLQQGPIPQQGMMPPGAPQMGDSVPNIQAQQPPNSALGPQQQPQHPPQLAHVMLQQQNVLQTHPPIQMPAHQAQHIQQPPQQQQQQQQVPQQQQQPPQQQPPPQQQVQQQQAQIQAVAAAPAPPQSEPEPPAAAAPEEPATAELISFD